MSSGDAPLTIGVVTDLHFTPHGAGLAYHGPFDVPGVLDRLTAALGWFADAGADCVIVAGDLVNDGDSDSLDLVIRTLSADWSGRVHIVPGNHDVLVREDALQRAATDRVSVLQPAGRIVKGIRLAGIGWDLGPSAAATAAWPGDEPAVLVSHFPVISRADAFAARGLRYAGDRPGIETIHSALAARSAPTVVINGHLHAADHVRDAQLLQLTVAALVERPFEAALITVQQDDQSLTVHRQARSLAPTCDDHYENADQKWVVRPQPDGL